MLVFSYNLLLLAGNFILEVYQLGEVFENHWGREVNAYLLMFESLKGTSTKLEDSKVSLRLSWPSNDNAYFGHLLPISSIDIVDCFCPWYSFFTCLLDTIFSYSLALFIFIGHCLPFFLYSFTPQCLNLGILKFSLCILSISLSLMVSVFPYTHLVIDCAQFHGYKYYLYADNS